MKTNEEKMLAGELYDPADGTLALQRQIARKIFRKFNSTADTDLLEELFAQKLNNVFIEPPFYCDYGKNIELGKNVFMNFNCVILDCAKVKLGDNVFMGPNVQIFTAEHPTNPEERNSCIEFAKPVEIGDNCWLGGGSIILAGVKIGKNCTIGAGSVVTRDIPENSVAVGNPCRVIKKLL